MRYYLLLVVFLINCGYSEPNSIDNGIDNGMKYSKFCGCYMSQNYPLRVKIDSKFDNHKYWSVIDGMNWWYLNLNEYADELNFSDIFVIVKENENVYVTEDVLEYDTLGQAEMGVNKLGIAQYSVIKLNLVEWNEKVVAHELGHVMGLEHDYNMDSIMNDVIRRNMYLTPIDMENVLEDLKND